MEASQKVQVIHEAIKIVEHSKLSDKKKSSVLQILMAMSLLEKAGINIRICEAKTQGPSQETEKSIFKVLDKASTQMTGYEETLRDWNKVFGGDSVFGKILQGVAGIAMMAPFMATGVLGMTLITAGVAAGGLEAVFGIVSGYCNSKISQFNGICKAGKTNIDGVNDQVQFSDNKLTSSAKIKSNLMVAMNSILQSYAETFLKVKQG
jgi:hypothetical protein